MADEHFWRNLLEVATYAVQLNEKYFHQPEDKLPIVCWVGT